MRFLRSCAICAVFTPAAAFAHPDAHSVADAALVSPAEIVDCTLETGEAAQCARYVVKYLPDDLEIGPFCPATLEDKGGIWHWDGEEAGLYRIDDDFLRMLDAQGYTSFNADGEVYSFDIRIEGPTEAHECIQGSVDPDVEMTVLIPTNPVMADEPTSLGTVAKVGIGLDGVPIFADAPSVLETGHMPALDTSRPRVARPSSTWRALADRGAYADAFAALGERALGEASRQSVSEDELYALADTARLSGHPRLAVTPLRRLMDEHASGVAALTLGRLQLDALDDPRGATRSLARADALSVPAHLAETLLARRVEAHRRAGDADTARSLAAAYLRAHPEGRYADRVRASAGDL